MTHVSQCLLDFFKRNYPLVTTCLVVSNFVLSCSAWRSVSPRHFYHTVTNEFFTTSVVTQYMASVPGSSVSNSPANSFSSPLPSEFPCRDYIYFLAGGRKAVRLWGRVYYPGSLTSRGRILDVFPDRVLLDNGDSIINSDRSFENDNGTIRAIDRNPTNH